MRGFLLFLLGMTAGCEKPGQVPAPPPDSLISLLSPAETLIRQAAPGLIYYSLRTLPEPWAIHLLRVELGRCELGLRVLEAPVPGEEAPGRNRVSTLMGSDGDVLAGVNGDFFTPEGLPLGTEIIAGETRRVRDRPALAWRPSEEPWMGQPDMEGDSVVVLGWSLPRVGGDGVTEGVGGFPLLLQEGIRVGDLEVSSRPSFAAERHPRTAVGFDRERNLLWILVVDGRQPDYSVGMTLPEVAGLMEALGVEEAINLDGGGSSVMILNGEAVSSPSDAEGERPVANALAIRRDAAYCSRSP